MKWQGFRVNSVCSPFGKLHCHCCHRYRHSHCSPPSSEMMNELLNCQFSFTCSSLQSLLLLLLLLYTCSSNYPCGVACPAWNWRGMRSINLHCSFWIAVNGGVRKEAENWIANEVAAMNWWVYCLHKRRQFKARPSHFLPFLPSFLQSFFGEVSNLSTTNAMLSSATWPVNPTFTSVYWFSSVDGGFVRWCPRTVIM